MYLRSHPRFRYLNLLSPIFALLHNFNIFNNLFSGVLSCFLKFSVSPFFFQVLLVGRIFLQGPKKARPYGPATYVVNFHLCPTRHFAPKPKLIFLKKLSTKFRILVRGFFGPGGGGGHFGKLKFTHSCRSPTQNLVIWRHEMTCYSRV